MNKNLYACHIKHGCDQDKLWEDYVDNNLPNKEDSDIIIEARNKYLKDHMGTREVRVIDITESEYPKRLKGFNGRPIVIEYIGAPLVKELIENTKDILFVDDRALAMRLKKKFTKAVVCFYERGLEIDGTTPSQSLNGLVFLYWHGPFEIREITIFMDLTSAALIGVQLAKVVLIKGDDIEIAGEIAQIAEKYHQPTQLLAIPGNSGCYANKLIKEYWSLCDCAKDVEESLKELKKRERESEEE